MYEFMVKRSGETNGTVLSMCREKMCLSRVLNMGSAEIRKKDRSK